VWAASETSVFAAEAGGVVRLVGRGFRVHTAIPIVGFGSGQSPWAVTADGALLEVIPKRIHRPAANATPIALEKVTVRTDRTAWALGRTSDGTAVIHQSSGDWKIAPAPSLAPGEVVVGFAVDRHGMILIATQQGAIHLSAADGTWSQGVISDALPAPRSGPSPARTR
jgi:hypothetical protein